MRDGLSDRKDVLYDPDIGIVERLREDEARVMFRKIQEAHPDDETLTDEGPVFRVTPIEGEQRR
ncbi:MAG: hypothetical protein V3R16_09670 [Nitrospirales bacterium]